MKYYYSIGKLQVESNIDDIPVPEHFRKNELNSTPNIIITQTPLDFTLQEKGVRRGHYYYYHTGSSLYIDFILPINVKLILSNLEGRPAEIKFTKYFKRFGNLKGLVESVILTKLIQTGQAFIHAGGVAHKGRATLISGMGGMGKSSVVITLSNTFRFMSDDRIIVDRNGYAYPYPDKVGVGLGTTGCSLPKRTRYRMKLYQLISKSGVLETIISKLFGELKVAVEPNELFCMSTKAKIDNLLILDINNERHTITRLTEPEALRKTLVTTDSELYMLPYNHYLSLYSYLLESDAIDFMRLLEERKNIIESALANAKFYKVNTKKFKPSEIIEFLEVSGIGKG